MLAIAPIKRGIEFCRCPTDSISSNSRQKQLHRGCVVLIILPEQLVERLRFDAHDRNIDAQKQHSEDQSQYQPPGRDRESRTDHKAAEIEWIARVSVRAGSGECVILSQVTRRPCAQSETRQRDQASDDERPW